jgi:hypothetical protein
MHIPEACVACGFEEKADDHEVGVANALRWKMMSGEERLESQTHAGGILKSFSLLTNGANKLREWDALRGKCGLSGCLPIRLEAGRGGQGCNCGKDKQAQQRFHRNQSLPSL